MKLRFLFPLVEFCASEAVSELHLGLPGSDEARVGFNQVVGDVPARQVQHGVPRGLLSLVWRRSTCPVGTDGHHGKFLTGAALAGRRWVGGGPLGTLEDVLHHGGDVGTLPLGRTVAAGHSGGESGQDVTTYVAV